MKDPILEPIGPVLSTEEAGELFAYYKLMAAGGYIHAELLPSISRFLLSKVESRVNDNVA